MTREELRSELVNGRHDQGSIEEVVVLFAARLGNEQATVTCGAVEKASFVGRCPGYAGNKPGRWSRVVRGRSPP